MCLCLVLSVSVCLYMCVCVCLASWLPGCMFLLLHIKFAQFRSVWCLRVTFDWPQQLGEGNACERATRSKVCNSNLKSNFWPFDAIMHAIVVCLFACLFRLYIRICRIWFDFVCGNLNFAAAGLPFFQQLLLPSSIHSQGDHKCHFKVNYDAHT